MKRMKCGMAMLSLLMLMAMGRAESPAEVEYVNGQRVFIKSPNWYPKDDGRWLFTCRLEVAADRLVKPVAHLHFYSMEGEAEEAEIVWEHKAIVRRNKFDKSFGSRKAYFVRVFLDQLPDGIEAFTVAFKNEPPQAKTAE